ncbi:F-actin-capping protein subunit beta [Bulinus truncatus]|nr:F-actin-capping protein subunit beta [Bulinus truncatus]
MISSFLIIQGGDAKSVSTSTASSAPAPPTSGGAPPPPPPPGPPPPPPPALSSSKDDEGAAAKAALFAQLNKGEDVTKGLKKVTDDMKTHKNPTLRQGPAPFKPTPGAKPQTSPKPGAKSVVVPAKPPLIELQDKKWIVEYHKDNKNIILDNTEIKQTVYVYKCEGSVIQVKGKVNSIILDSCKKTAVVFDDLVSSVEFVNCQSMQAQVTGKVPTLSIDKTDGCLVYLSPLSLDVEIVTAKSSEMNILVPQGDGDYKEFALPEQFKSKYDGALNFFIALYGSILFYVYYAYLLMSYNSFSAGQKSFVNV